LSSIGFDKIFAELRTIYDEKLETQVQIYEEEREADKKLVNARYLHISPDPATLQLENLDWCIAKLQELYSLHPKRLEALSPFIVDLISINPTSELGSSKWALIARTVHQISLINNMIEIDKESSLHENEEKDFLYQIDLPQLLYNIFESEADDVFPVKQELKETEIKIDELSKFAKVKESQIGELRAQIKKMEEEVSSSIKLVEELSKQTNDVQIKVNSMGGDSPAELLTK